MHSVYSHMCLWKRTCMTSFVLPSRVSGVHKETKGYQGLLLIENQNKALALSEYMNSSNYGNHRKESQLLSPWGMRIIDRSRCLQLARSDQEYTYIHGNIKGSDPNSWHSGPSDKH